MWASIRRILDTASKYLNWLPLLFGCGVVTALGGVSAWVTLHTAWLVAYGPAAWWFAALIGVLIGTALIMGLAFVRYQWIKASAFRKWKERVDSINPMDAEFNRRRIKISDLGNYSPPFVVGLARATAQAGLTDEGRFDSSSLWIATSSLLSPKMTLLR